MYIPNKALGSKFKSFNHIESYFSKFEKIAPSQSDIVKNYQNAKNYYMTLVNTMSTLTNELNATEEKYISLDEVISQTLSFIQQGNLWEYVNKNKKQMVISLEEGEKLLNQWQSIILLIEQNQWQSANNGLIRLQNMCFELQRQLTNNKTINLNKILNIQNGKTSTVANSMQGTLSAIRGAVLEEKIVDFLSKKLPDTNNTTFIQTGQVRYQIPIMGNKSMDIKEDIIEVMNGFTINDLNGKPKYVFQNGEIIDKRSEENNTSIILTESEYQTLQKAILQGISAKTTSGTITFHGGYNINQLLINAGFPVDKIVTQLYHFYQLGIGFDIDLYQRYAVSKIAIDIIGKKNSFLGTKTKIIPTYLYIEQIMDKGLYFSNKKLPTREENANLNTNFGITNIIGSPLKT